VRELRPKCAAAGAVLSHGVDIDSDKRIPSGRHSDRGVDVTRWMDCLAAAHHARLYAVWDPWFRDCRSVPVRGDSPLVTPSWWVRAEPVPNGVLRLSLSDYHRLCLLARTSTNPHRIWWLVWVYPREGN